jgi:hypothetical protein
MSIAKNQLEYVRWQNRSFRFYLPARMLVILDSDSATLNSAALFCGQQSLETLLKATVLYFDPSFSPKSANHSWHILFSRLAEVGVNLRVPEYLCGGSRLQQTTRYPSGLIPVVPTYLADLDRAFTDLIVCVPYQRGTELRVALSKTRRGPFRFLARRNSQTRRLRSHVNGSSA